MENKTVPSAGNDEKYMEKDNLGAGDMMFHFIHNKSKEN